ncbi:Integrase, catalytic core protein [Phytophthora megakarya]|uniref:Integrase, catalytic core protein n=1 Tax=Phytophthora megakarya TaxID=4795 RepID=A0A225WEI4_9STRA|nr:Integrase, catalytic core protein [Phytophthora megakarya]
MHIRMDIGLTGRLPYLEASAKEGCEDAKAITCCWMFAVKRDERGRVKRFKARLVIHGFKQQQQGVNYNETYAPRDWDVLQYDVKTAFLYGDLVELIFMKQPAGFQVDGPNYIWRQLKSLYGLKQAPNIWNKTIHPKLMTMGIARTDSDYGLYVLMENGKIKLLLIVYCANIAELLQETLELTMMGTVTYLLGVEFMVDRQRRQILYCQKQYVVEVLKQFHMENCNVLLYLRQHRPQMLACQLGLLTRHTENLLCLKVGHCLCDSASRQVSIALRPHTHYAQAKRVLRYFKSTCNYGLVMDVQMQKNVRICSYSGADYANDPVDRRIISGYDTMINDNVLSYASRKQEINALKSCEEVYVAISVATNDLKWLAGLCKELYCTHPVPLLYGDNQGAIELTLKPGNHSKSKNIDNKHHMVRRNVELKRIDTQHVGTDAMVTDVMTNALGAMKIAGFREAMKVLSLVGENDVTPASQTADETCAMKSATIAAKCRDKGLILCD